MLLAGCSTVCTTVAEAAKMWNLVVVSIFMKIELPSNAANFEMSPVVLRCIVPSIVRSKQVPDIVQNPPIGHGAQSDENQTVAKVRLV